MGGRHTHQQLTRNAVTATVGIGLMVAHVAPCYARGPASQLIWILAQCGGALEDHKGIRRCVVINAQADAWVAPQVGGLYSGMPGGEHKRIAVKVEPDRRDMRPAIGTYS